MPTEMNTTHKREVSPEFSGSSANKPYEGFLVSSGANIHYFDWLGSGKETHFLHANGFCSGTYAPLLKLLAQDLHIVASDIRGHGDSDSIGIERISHWDIFVNDLKNVAEQRMSPPVIGIGHSLGAVTTYLAAAKYPHLFSKIILIEPVILPKRILRLIALMKLFGIVGLIPHARIARKRKRIFENKDAAFMRFASGRGAFKTWSKDFIDAYLECGILEKDDEKAVLKCNPETEAQIFESVPLDVWKYADKIKCPVLAIRGYHSDSFYSDAASDLKKYIRDYELETVPNAGHFLPMEKPVECAKIIIRFLNRREDARSGIVTPL
jgi:pimeloyl-ACP methyl ester carboxylesterase